MLQTIRLSRSHGQTITLRYIYPLGRLERCQGRGKSHRQDYRVAGEPEEPGGESAGSSRNAGRQRHGNERNHGGIRTARTIPDKRRKSC